MNSKVDGSYLSDSNHDNEEGSEYYDNEYRDDEMDFENLDLDEPLEEERDTSTTLTFRNKRTFKVWQFFDERTSEHPGLPVCKKCGSKFSAEIGISSLKHHMLK